MGDFAGAGLGHARLRQLQREGAPREDHAARRAAPGASATVGSGKRWRTPTSKMSCYTCHTSVDDELFRLPPLHEGQLAIRPSLHYEGDVDTRNFTTYNSQVLRDDVFMLGLDSTAKKNKIVPVRSSSAVLVSSQNANREWIYHPGADRFLRRGTAARRSIPTTRTRCEPRKPRPAPIATFPATTTTMPGWRSCSCRAPIS